MLLEFREKEYEEYTGKVKITIDSTKILFSMKSI